MKKLLGIFILFLGLISFLAGCMEPKEAPAPKNLIGENNYVDLMLEMQHIKTYSNAYPDSVNTDSLKSIVFNRFGISEEQFLTSHEYYQKQTKAQIKRVNEVINRLNQEEQYIQLHIDSVKSQRKSVSDSTTSE